MHQMVRRRSKSLCCYPASDLTLVLLAIDGLSVIRDMHPANLKSDGTRGHYSGPPSDKIDQAWNELFEPRDIRISSTELEANERTSVQLPDGGGHLAWLGVFHELHCVVRFELVLNIIFLEY